MRKVITGEYLFLIYHAKCTVCNEVTTITRRNIILSRYPMEDNAWFDKHRSEYKCVNCARADLPLIPMSTPNSLGRNWVQELHANFDTPNPSWAEYVTRDVEATQRLQFVHDESTGEIRTAPVNPEPPIHPGIVQGNPGLSGNTNVGDFFVDYSALETSLTASIEAMRARGVTIADTPSNPWYVYSDSVWGSSPDPIDPPAPRVPSRTGAIPVPSNSPYEVSVTGRRRVHN